jgi:hypothetical protein
MKTLGLDAGLPLSVLEEAANSLIANGMIEEGVVGKRANRMPRYGLLLTDQALKDNVLKAEDNGSDLV